MATNAVITDSIAKHLKARNVFSPLKAKALPDFAVSEGGFPFAIDHLVGDLSPTSALLVVVPTLADVETLVFDLREFSHRFDVLTLPSWDTLPFERISPRLEAMAARSRAIWHLSNRHRRQKVRPLVVVATARGVAQKIKVDQYKFDPVEVRVGGEIDRDKLARDLAAFGFTRVYQVEGPGEFSVRGSIVDLFPPARALPVRVDLFGDEVDRLVEFSLVDQLAINPIDELSIYPVREVRPDPTMVDSLIERIGSSEHLNSVVERFANEGFFEGMESFVPFIDDFSDSIFDLLSNDDLVLISDRARVAERTLAIIEEEKALIAALAPTWQVETEDVSLYVDLAEVLTRGNLNVVDRVMNSMKGEVELPFVSASLPDHRSESIVTSIRSDLAAKARVLISTDAPYSANRIIASLKDEGVGAFAVRNRSDFDALMSGAKKGVGVYLSDLEVGFRCHSASLVVMGTADLAGRRAKRTSIYAQGSARNTTSFFDDLKVGGYVVHEFHGVGRYLGIVRRSIANVERDYLEIEYRDSGKLFIPTDQMGALTPYSGGESPTLSRLGGSDWQKTKAKVKASVERVAQELVLLYQKRQASKGFIFAEDNEWQREMEDQFPFTLTRDQAKAIEMVKDDMESERPMDRLICGDVGFGKTEVAIRAAFKATQSSKQVAVLVPTTLLAHQHYATFSERFAPFPLRVEVVSRFQSPQEVREILSALARGEVDVIIGTHRLLSKDVKFSNLGLLVVDEEQRFGVNHKELIKSMSVNVDVLTMSATPIPRTLEMSLTGLRDLSLLTTPPGARQPIMTYVGGYDEGAVVEAIRRELLREGQVFYVHNRVMDIDQVAMRLATLVPEARIAVAHGQMDENLLERVVDDFWRGNYDVLVCTTIIESGIDMPTVNTLVVNRAENLGLGQLHQLRGRVGRAGVKAYAYLFHTPNRKLTDEAYERLKTIGEAVELGSGFKIAMRDLEIRGAGSLLGQSQSGHVAAVGYDLYVKLVKEAIDFLNGEETPVIPECRIEIPLSASIPPEYIEKEDLRLEAYKELADCKDDGAVDSTISGLSDRFGPTPEPLLVLGEITKIRNRATSLGLSELKVSKKSSSFDTSLKIALVGATVPASVMANLKRRFRSVSFRDKSSTLDIDCGAGHEVLATTKELLDLIISRSK
ncbi:MAG: transcription-repair coupling factor [Actinomycetota bacterium]|nr:transcription-repair coupling factor [Actinomycetota bacterium]